MRLACASAHPRTHACMTRPHARSHTMQELAARDVFKKVILVGRRQVELPKGPGYEKMVRHVQLSLSPV